MNLSWQANGSQMQLITVDDESDKLCEIFYDAENSISVWPNSSEKYTVTLATENSYLSSFIIEAGSYSFTWAFEYTTIDDQKTLISLTAPTGYRETVNYTAGIMKFPPGAPIASLPAVVQYQQFPGMGQPATTTTYEYTSPNYLGYGIVNSWNAAQDNLCTVLSTYTYASTEVIQDDDGTEQRTSRTYNNYHLLINETISKGTCTRSTDIEYYAELGVEFESQTPQFQARKSITMTWSDSGRSQQPRIEVTTTTYDDHGNLLTRQLPDGRTATWTYYPSEGEAENGNTGCPPDPNGFVSHAKSKTVRAAQSRFSDEPDELTEYQYISLATRSGSPASSCVLPALKTRSRNGATLSCQAFTYDHADDNYGNVATVVDTTFDTTDTSKSYATTLVNTRAQNGDALDKTGTLTGFDGTSWTMKSSHSRFSNRLLSVIDRLGNEAQLSYDPAGRLVSRTLSPDTPYENIINASYSISKDSSGNVTDVVTTITDASGNKMQLHFDGEHRLLRRAQNAMDAGLGDEWFNTIELNYDAFGRQCNGTVSDYPTPSNGGANQLRVDAEFDNWGHVVSFEYSSGQIYNRSYDPILNTLTTSVTSPPAASNPFKLGQKVTTYDVAKSPIQISRFYASGADQSTATYEYDGLGRLRTQTDELGQITAYDYDYFDRVSKQTLADGTIVEKTYAAHSARKLITSITVTGKDENEVVVTIDLGSQTFDGLERLTKTSNGGRTQSLTYSDASSNPSTLTDNLGITLNYQYIPELSNAILQVTGPTLQQDFTYDKVTANATSANAINSNPENLTEQYDFSSDMEWTTSGLLKKQTQTIQGTDYTSNTEWTLMGNPYSYTDMMGRLQQATYDSFGRLSGISDPDIKISFAYDDAGRLSSQTATDPLANVSLATTFTYDDFSREIKREFTPSTGNKLTIERTYQLNNRLATREFSYPDKMLRSEIFAYDIRNRLITYECTGDSPPVDGYEIPIQTQCFYYTAWNNIYLCTTQPVDGYGDQDEAQFIYGNETDPTQLTNITHSGNSAYPSSIELQYDANGRMTLDWEGRSYTYDSAGRLYSVSMSSNGKSVYSYDAQDMLVLQQLDDNDVRYLFYHGKTLANELRKTTDQVSRFIQTGTGCAAVSTETLSAL
ncbi:MAG TPA: hypothetical protein VGL08_03660 [Paraburkholderia sp.]